VTTNYFGQSFESFRTIAVLVALILTNDELLIGIEDIRTITGRIYKGTESDRSDGVVDFGSNNRVTWYTPQEAQHQGSKISNKRSFKSITIVLYERATANSISYRAKTGLMTVGCKTRINEV